MWHVLAAFYLTDHGENDLFYYRIECAIVIETPEHVNYPNYFSWHARSVNQRYSIYII